MRTDSDHEAAATANEAAAFGASESGSGKNNRSLKCRRGSAALGVGPRKAEVWEM